MSGLVPVLTPRGHLFVENVDHVPALPDALARRLHDSIPRAAAGTES